MRYDPPGYALRFFRWYCTKELVEEIEGDLYENFIEDVNKYGNRKAKWLYYLNVLQFLKPFTLKQKLFTNNLISIAMYKNYFLIAIRNLKSKIGYSIVNVAGLALGIASCIVIMLFVKYEYSYESFQKDIDNTYRVALIIE